MLILAFDTATDLATSALVADGVTLGERVTRPQSLLADVDALLGAAGVAPADLTGIVVGTGPGSFTGTRIGLSVARGLALSLELPVAGVSTLDGPRRGCSERAFPVIDARRGEVFVLGPRAVRPRMSWSRREASASVTAPPLPRRAGREGRRCRPTTPSCMCRVPRSTPRSPRPSFGPADEVEPVYVREPDAKRWVA